jgi:hypothetical protein
MTLNLGCTQNDCLRCRDKVVLPRFVLAIVNCQCLLSSSMAMLLDDRVMNIPAVHATVSVRPHVSNSAVEIQEVIPDHETVAA